MYAGKMVSKFNYLHNVIRGRGACCALRYLFVDTRSKVARN